MRLIYLGEGNKKVGVGGWGGFLFPFVQAPNAKPRSGLGNLRQACVQLDARAAQLVLLVRRWAKANHVAVGQNQRDSMLG